MIETPNISEENETRASIYWWFATVFTKELDKQQLAAYTTGEGAQLLKQLADTAELSPAVKLVNNHLAKCMALQHPELELAADFCQQFLSDSKVGAPPYASIYLSSSKLMYQEPHEQMLALLVAQGLRVDPEFNEPADHLAIQLDYLGNLIMREDDNPQQQAEFIQQHLLSWLPQWLEALSKVSKGGFYQGFAELLVAYLRLELQHL
ncbi:molecular chaperone TorD [Agarivorans sp. 1_MG-2023]|uniref:molecular chaperone TorD n=1 Tax=Agarivorans sp. 1_MG-2023 TaxID=3062634 RepID=UPI0026E1AD1F|nr:molecular chaperone TorD [Agarivorans sp. 1_MG-2023]MDO6763184.1 molecular chaperone TorD [Agarivorans sp. 1_MG-2023]